MSSKRTLRRKIARLEADLFEARQAIFREALRAEGMDKKRSLSIGYVQPSFTVRCTCPPNRGDNYAGNCPVHDSQTTYTGSWA